MTELLLPSVKGTDLGLSLLSCFSNSQYPKKVDLPVTVTLCQGWLN